MNLDLIYSRPQKTAEGLAGLAVDHHRFLTKKVLLTGEPHVLASSNGAQCFFDSIRLLIRICPNIVIDVSRVPEALLPDGPHHHRPDWLWIGREVPGLG